MHAYRLYQPITKCPKTGQMIVWFVLRPDGTPPGQLSFSEMLSPDLCENFDELQEGAAFVSQCMTRSELDALRGFLKRHTSYAMPEGKEFTAPLRASTIGLIWDDLDTESIHLDELPGFDLPWTVRGRILEYHQKKRPSNSGKAVFTAVLLLFLLLVGCASAPDELTNNHWSVPPHVPTEITVSVEDKLAEIDEITSIENYEEYVWASVLYRSVYEYTGRRVALWRHLSGLMLWLRYEYGARNNIPDMITSNLDNVIKHGQAAAEPHEFSLPERFAKQNQRMITAARAARESDLYLETAEQQRKEQQEREREE